MPNPTPYPPYPRHIVVYTEGLVLTPTAKTALERWVAAQPAGPDKEMWERDLKNTVIPAAEVANAGFETIIVGLWHVHPGGKIYYNDFPINDNTAAAFTESFKELKTADGSTVKYVLISFGGGNWWGHPRSVSDDDYPNMKAAWSTFKPALCDLLSNSNADGVDWDYEPEETPFDDDFIIKITNEMVVQPQGQVYWVTAAPYKNRDDWQKVIQNTLCEGGTKPGNNFAFWHLQLYGGAVYKDWVAGLGKIHAGFNPMTQVQSFLVPGYKMEDCNSPLPAGDISALRKDYPYLNGAFIWNYDLIKGCAKDVAESIRKVFST